MGEKRAWSGVSQTLLGEFEDGSASSGNALKEGLPSSPQSVQRRGLASEASESAARAIYRLKTIFSLSF